MNKKNQQKIISNSHQSINAQIRFVLYKPNFWRKFFKSKIETELVSKFGGQPCLITQDEWPISTRTGKPMKFICQIMFDSKIFPEAPDKVAYLFLTDHLRVFNAGYPGSAENAVIIKSITDSKISTKNLFRAQGPTLDEEYRIALDYKEEPDFQGNDWDENQYEEYFNIVEGSKIGGSPSFIHRDTPNIEEGYRLLLQLDSSDTPFEIDFGGGGVGYLFVNEDCTKGKFLWQCD